MTKISLGRLSSSSLLLIACSVALLCQSTLVLSHSDDNEAVGNKLMKCHDGKFRCVATPILRGKELHGSDKHGCISKKKLCDGKEDCADGSDESPTLCSKTDLKGLKENEDDGAMSKKRLRLLRRRTVRYNVESNSHEDSDDDKEEEEDKKEKVEGSAYPLRRSMRDFVADRDDDDKDDEEKGKRHDWSKTRKRQRKWLERVFRKRTGGDEEKELEGDGGDEGTKYGRKRDMWGRSVSKLSLKADEGGDESGNVLFRLIGDDRSDGSGNIGVDMEQLMHHLKRMRHGSRHHLRRGRRHQGKEKFGESEEEVGIGMDRKEEEGEKGREEENFPSRTSHEGLRAIARDMLFRGMHRPQGVWKGERGRGGEKEREERDENEGEAGGESEGEEMASGESERAVPIEGVAGESIAVASVPLEGSGEEESEGEEGGGVGVGILSWNVEGEGEDFSEKMREQIEQMRKRHEEMSKSFEDKARPRIHNPAIVPSSTGHQVVDGQVVPYNAAWERADGTLMDSDEESDSVEKIGSDDSVGDGVAPVVESAEGETDSTGEGAAESERTGEEQVFKVGEATVSEGEGGEKSEGAEGEEVEEKEAETEEKDGEEKGEEESLVTGAGEEGEKEDEDEKSEGNSTVEGVKADAVGEEGGNERGVEEDDEWEEREEGEQSVSLTGGEGKHDREDEGKEEETKEGEEAEGAGGGDIREVGESGDESALFGFISGIRKAFVPEIKT